METRSYLEEGIVPKISMLNQSYPTDCKTLLQLRSECSGYTYFLNSGYINYYIDNTFKPYEHRLVAEMAYGTIPDGHQVHHINGIRSDNRAINLQVIDPSNHAHLHHGVAIPAIVVCTACGKTLPISQARLERNEQSFCNRACYRSAVSREPDPQVLQEQLDKIRNLTAVGRIYDVSHTTVRKWVKKHGLNTSTCNGRKFKVAHRGIDPLPAP